MYESGDKNGRFLYWLVAGQRTSQIVPSVLNESGELCSGTPAVAEAFALFYKKLYAERDRADRVDEIHDLGLLTAGSDWSAI